MMYYVYFLTNLDEDVLLYVGCTTDVRSRWLAFMRREEIPASIWRVYEYATNEEAAQAERDAILRWNPPFNIRVASARGSRGMHLGPRPVEVGRKISASLKGKKHTEERRRRNGETHKKTKGPQTPEHKRRIAEALRRHHAAARAADI